MSIAGAMLGSPSANMTESKGRFSATAGLIRAVAVRLCFLLSVVAGVSAYGQALPDPERFENAILRFEALDSESPPPVGAIVLTGSSSIARWNDRAAEALAPLTVIPRGFGGSVMNDVLHYVDRVAIAYRPRAILIYEGDNDTGLSQPIPTATILDQLRRIIDRVHLELPGTRIYLLSVKPSILRWNVWPLAQEVSAGYRSIAEGDPLVYYVDVATPLLNADGSLRPEVYVEDGLHLNDLGNSIWGTAIKNALMPVEAGFE